MRAPALLLAMLCLVPAVPARAAERILDFQSRITVLRDGSMDVQETIRVAAEGHHIRHGIYRDIPTEYRDRLGNRYHVGFRLLSVQLDHHPEPYHLERRANGIRVYMGRSNVLLRPGTYTFTLDYRTDR